MGIFRQFPYTNFHDLNLDWLIGEVKRITADWLTLEENIEKWKNDYDEAFEELKNYVLNFFDENNVKEEIIKYIDDLKDDGFFDEVINNLSLRIYDVTANIIWQRFNDVYNDEAQNIDGITAIGNGMMAIYHSKYGDDGRLTIIDIDSGTEISSIIGLMYHGNSLTYKDNKIYICSAFKNSDQATLIPDIVVVNVTDPYNPIIEETIIPPLPSYSTGIYSLSYDPVTDKFYGICARGTTSGEFNRVIVYNDTLDEIVSEVVANGIPAVNSQGIQTVYNGIAYFTYYDMRYYGYLAYDLINNKIVNMFKPPLYLNNYRYIGELESICYDPESDKWYGSCRLSRNGVFGKTLSTVFEVGMYKNIVSVDVIGMDHDQRGRSVAITVTQGDNTITKDISQMVCIQDAINISKNADVYPIIRLSGTDKNIASLEIIDFAGVITGTSSDHIIFKSGILIMNSAIRFTYCDFEGNLTDPYTGQSCNVSLQSSDIRMAGCTVTDKVSASESMINAQALIPLYLIRSLLLGSITPASSTFIQSYRADDLQ